MTCWRLSLAGLLGALGVLLLLGSQIEAQLIPQVAGQKYSAVAVHFDGANDYLTRDADLTGAADGKQGLISGWLQTSSVSSVVLANATALAGATTRFSVGTTGTGKLQVAGRNAANTLILNIQTTAALNNGTWFNFAISFDLTDTGKRHIYVNGSSDLNAVTYTNDALDLSQADWAIAALASGGSKTDIYLGDILFWPTYLDLSVAANRRLFYSNGHAVNPGSAIRQLGTPLVMLSGAKSAWHTNKGSGGGFTLHGGSGGSLNGGSPPP